MIAAKRQSDHRLFQHPRPSMRRPVGVKSILFVLGETLLVSRPSGHCRHASIRTLEERFHFARCMLGVLVTVGAAICLAPCGSALSEWNLGQAINAVTGTRLWLLSFHFLERF